MTSPREIIAKRIAGSNALAWVDKTIEALNAAGFHILSDADLQARDDAVLERAAVAAASHITEPGLSDNPAYVRFERSHIMAKRIALSIRAMQGGKP